jgi:hypothetical protein
MSQECLAESVLRAWLSDSLEQPAAQVVEAHVEICLACQQCVEHILDELPGLRPADDENISSQARHPNESQIVAFVQGNLAKPQQEVLQDEPAAATPLYIGRYRVKSILGEGGFGVVYLGHEARHREFFLTIKKGLQPRCGPEIFPQRGTRPGIFPHVKKGLPPRNGRGQGELLPAEG